LHSCQTCLSLSSPRLHPYCLQTPLLSQECLQFREQPQLRTTLLFFITIYNTTNFYIMLSSTQPSPSFFPSFLSNIRLDVFQSLHTSHTSLGFDSHHYQATTFYPNNCQHGTNTNEDSDSSCEEKNKVSLLPCHRKILQTLANNNQSNYPPSIRAPPTPQRRLALPLSLAVPETPTPTTAITRRSQPRLESSDEGWEGEIQKTDEIGEGVERGSGEETG
jgi:hypothetical protein